MATDKKGRKAPANTPEVIVLPPNDQAQEGAVHVKKVPTIDQRAKNEVKKIDLTKKAIDTLVKKYDGLTIAGVDDKKGIEAVDTARKDLKKKASAIDNKRKEINADYLAITRKVNEYAADLEAPLRDAQKRAESKLKVIQDQLDEQERERKEQAQAELDRRVNELLEAGIAFNGRFYAIGQNISVDVVSLGQYNAEEYELLVTAVKDEKKRLDEQAEIEEREAQAERDRVQKQKEENDRLQAQNDALQNQLREAMEQRTTMRRQFLTGLGLAVDLDKKAFIMSNPSGSVEIGMDVVVGYEPTMWDTLLTSTQNLVREISQKEETRIKELNESIAQYNNRSGQLKGLGFTFEPYLQEFIFTQTYTGKRATIADKAIRDASQQSFEAIVLDLKNQLTILAQDAEDQAVLDAQFKEKERQAGLSDAEKVKEYLNELQAIAPPELQLETYKDILTIIDATLVDQALQLGKYQF
jgi:hypothetical protein